MYSECHGHIMLDGKDRVRAAKEHENGVRIDIIRDRLQQYADNNVTFFRDGGDGLGAADAAKEIAGEYGIDFRSPCFAIHKNGCYGDFFGRGFDSVTDYRMLVEEVKKGGGDYIKLMLTGIMDFDTRGKILGGKMTEEEVKETIKIAHGEGFAVMAHVNTPEMLCFAAMYGADSVEHGYMMDEKSLYALKESNTVWVPTIAPTAVHLGTGNFNDDVMDWIVSGHRAAIKKALEIGVTLASGSDAGSGGLSHDNAIFTELRFLHEAAGEKNAKCLDEALERGNNEIKRRFKRQ